VHPCEYRKHRNREEASDGQENNNTGRVPGQYPDGMGTRFLAEDDRGDDASVDGDGGQLASRGGKVRSERESPGAPERIPGEGVGDEGRRDPPADTEAAQGVLLSELSGTSKASGAGVAGSDSVGMRVGGKHAEAGRLGASPGTDRRGQEQGIADLQGAGRGSKGLPQPPVGGGPSVPLAGRAVLEGAAEPSDPQYGRRAGERLAREGVSEISCQQTPVAAKKRRSSCGGWWSET